MSFWQALKRICCTGEGRSQMDPGKRFCAVHGEWHTSTLINVCPQCAACVSYLQLVEKASKAGEAMSVEGVPKDCPKCSTHWAATYADSCVSCGTPLRETQPNGVSTSEPLLAPWNVQDAINAARAQERAAIVAWLRGVKARIEGCRKAGAIELHYMHTIGLTEGCEQSADAIERGEHWSDKTHLEKP